jgi:hypothetical protein
MRGSGYHVLCLPFLARVACRNVMLRASNNTMEQQQVDD